MLFGFQNYVLQREREGENLLFCDFYIIISQIFPETFIEIPQVVQKILRFFHSMLPIFIDFLSFLTFACFKETNDVSM